MRCVRCSDGRVEVVDAPPPRGEGVRVKIRSAGICGSDLHLIDSPFAPGVTLGHEMAGELDDGRFVAIEPFVGCAQCDACRRGDYNLCAQATSDFMGVSVEGGMAEEVRVPARALVPLPAGVSPADACLVEPLAVAVHGLRKVGHRGDRRVAIIGAGTIGLCAAAAARGAGSEVGLAARHEVQREAGARLGVSDLEGQYDLVIDCAGSKGALEQAVGLARPGGHLLLLASYWDGLELPGFALCMKELVVIPSSMYGRGAAGRDVDAAAALLASEPEIARAIITHRRPLEAAPEAFALAADRGAGAIKVVLEP